MNSELDPFLPFEGESVRLIWNTKDGRPVYVDEMEDGHLMNCWKMLKRWENVPFSYAEYNIRITAALRVFEAEMQRRGWEKNPNYRDRRLTGLE